MRAQTFLLVIFFLSCLLGCRGCFQKVSEEIILPDQNPELINYLQGSWACDNQDKLVLEIKRDSIAEIINDSIKSVSSLYYSFTGHASKYFTKDSAFDFLLASKHNLSTSDFSLIEIDKNSGNTIQHILAYVSKSKVEMNLQGRFVRYHRIK